MACFHSAAWWQKHWERTGIMKIELADSMPDGWQVWLDWQRTICPDNKVELAAIEADQGRTIGYFRVVGRRRAEVKLDAPLVTVPADYVRQPLLRT
jgi:hypothetical protein